MFWSQPATSAQRLRRSSLTIQGRLLPICCRTRRPTVLDWLQRCPPHPQNRPSSAPGTALQLSLHANSTHSLAAPRSAAAHVRLALAHRNHYFPPPCTDAVTVSGRSGVAACKGENRTRSSFRVKRLLVRPLIGAAQGARRPAVPCPQTEASALYSKYKHVLCPGFCVTC